MKKKIMGVALVAGLVGGGSYMLLSTEEAQNYMPQCKKACGMNDHKVKVYRIAPVEGEEVKYGCACRNMKGNWVRDSKHTVLNK